MSASLTSIPLLGPKLQAARAQLSLRSGKLVAGKRALELLQTLVFFFFLLRWSSKTYYQLRGHGIYGSLRSVFLYLRRTGYGYFLSIPQVRRKIEKDVSHAVEKMEKTLTGFGPGVNRYSRLPAEGWSDPQVKAELGRLNEMEHTRWEDGRVSGAVYHGGQDLVDVQVEAYKMFTVANPIHPDVFPGVRKMEAEVVAMVLSIFNAPPGAAGVTTSGGTESILMAVLSAREKGRAERSITAPEMILPETAHTAFRKAASYFNIRVHLVPCPSPTHQVNLRSVRRLINPNTILLVGSAPNFPHGIIDDIAPLSTLAQRHQIPLHVDCCLGSFMIPFLSRAGFESVPFDFTLPGVTSISVDTHKYGFAPKGNSTVLYRTKQLRSYQYYICPDWSGGVYASPSIAGSRPGALIAGCWASMMRTGEEGYISACRSIVGAAKKLEEAVRTDDVLSTHLSIIGKPLVSVVAFTSKDRNMLDIYELADGMSAKGWHLNALQNPPGIHVAVTLPIVAAVDSLLADLKEVVEQVIEKEKVRRASGGKVEKKGDNTALYGVAASIPDKRVVNDLARAFLDTLYRA